MHGMAEDFLTFHAEEAASAGCRRPPVDIEDIVVIAFGVQMRRENASLAGVPLRLRTLQHHGASAIAEEDAGTTILPIENARERLGADDERPTSLAGANE